MYLIGTGLNKNDVLAVSPKRDQCKVLILSSQEAGERIKQGLFLGVGIPWLDVWMEKSATLPCLKYATTHPRCSGLTSVFHCLHVTFAKSV